MCECISYNQPSLGGTEVSVIANNPHTGYDVSLDPCIAEVVKDLWKAGVRTCGSCCGHNGKLGAPLVAIWRSDQIELSRNIAAGRVKIVTPINNLIYLG